MTDRMIHQYKTMAEVNFSEVARRIRLIKNQQLVEMYGGDAVTPEPVLTPAAQQRAQQDLTESERDAQIEEAQAAEQADGQDG